MLLYQQHTPVILLMDHKASLAWHRTITVLQYEIPSASQVPWGLSPFAHTFR
jgi:hypothetical protein